MLCTTELIKQQKYNKNIKIIFYTEIILVDFSHRTDCLPFGSILNKDIRELCTTLSSVWSLVWSSWARMSPIFCVCSLLSLHKLGKSLMACFRICNNIHVTINTNCISLHMMHIFYSSHSVWQIFKAQQYIMCGDLLA